jgi:hypothetical protein
MSHQARTITDALADADLSEPDDELVFDDVTGEETVDALPVLAEVRTLEPTSHVSLPAVKAAAAAATGFVAGAATLALVRRHSARKLARSRRLSTRRAAEMLPIVGSRTFLVDVHLIAKPGD